MTATLNVGVVGCGYWGPNLIRNFNSLPECRLKSVCDSNPARLKQVRSMYPDVVPETDFARMLDSSELDAVAIATPVHSHFGMANTAIQAGKHTFIEKPMAASSFECRELVDAAYARKLALMVGHTFLYAPAVRKIKELVEAGDIGDIRHIYSRRLNLGIYQRGVNVVWDLAPHDISIILHLMQETPVSVNCQGQCNIDKDIADVSTLTLTFASGRFATIHNSWLDPRKVREMTIVGDKRMIVYDDLDPVACIKVYDERVEVCPQYDKVTQKSYTYHVGDMYAPHVDKEEPLRAECRHFLSCVRSGRQPLTCGKSGMALVSILEAASRSMQADGACVELSPCQSL